MALVEEWSHTSSTVASDQDELARQLFVVNLLGLVFALTGLLWPLAWRSATAICGFGFAVYSVYLVRRGFPRWSTNLYVFGQAVGWTELLADAWLVQHTQTLVYPSGGPFVWCSPLYMPFAWGGLLTSNILLGVVIHRRTSLLRASLLITVLTGIYIPAYEYIAHASGWWSYRDTPMLFDVVPIYIVLGEALVGVPLVWVGTRLEQVTAARAALLGCAVGLLIFVAYACCYVLID
jgi:hypothetical protein